MKLIADSGSTKTQWALVDSDRADSPVLFETAGLNPTLMPAAEFKMALAEALAPLHGRVIDEVHYYGAGCTPAVAQIVVDSLRAVTDAQRVEAASDMLGAARGLCGDQPGIVAILGTGSNSCYYDGERIVANTPPLGYILGDEGSGARLGVALVNGVLKGYLSADICRSFHDSTGLGKTEIIERVYRQPAPNAFLASLVPFIAHNIADDESIAEMVKSEFRLFFERNIIHAYPAGNTINFVGSIAQVFESAVREVACEYGLEVGRIVRRPLPLIIDYHTRI